MSKRSTPILLFICATVVLSGLVGATSAFADTPVWWTTAYAVPKELPPGGNGQIVVDVSNLGNASMNGGTVKLVDKLPPGVTFTSIAYSNGNSFGTCSASEGAEVVTCEGGISLTPYQQKELLINVSVAKGASSSAANVVSVEGGGAQSVSGSDTVDFGSAPASFGVEKLEQLALNENGTPDTQAGSHPFEYVTTIQLNEQLKENNGVQVRAPALVKDLHFNLPPGLIGNPTVMPQCTYKQFTTYVGSPFVNECPADAAVGAANVKLILNEEGALFVPVFGPVPLFNLTPNVGEPARFGFQVDGIPVILDTSVRTGGDYGVVVSVNNINTQLQLTGSQVTFWGAPASRSHDQSRGYQCIAGGLWSNFEGVGPCVESPQGGPVAPPLLTLPTSCAGPLQSSVEADSWSEQGVFTKGEYTWHDSQGTLGMDGCNRLPFTPSISVTPDGPDASTPTGLAVTEHVPQEDTLTPTGLAEDNVKNTTVALPAGVQISPAGGDGLLACSTEELGFKGANSQGELEFSSEEQACPEASKVGTVKIRTPLLPNPLTGAVYLGQQNANPFGSLVAMYVVAKDPVSGVLIKAAGEVTPNPVTGQLVTTFKNTPQLPYENLELHFFGSARAPLSTPPLCGPYTTHASIEGYAGNPPAEPSSTFQITAGPGGGPCSAPQPFSPGFESGSTNLQAGAFTPFELTMSRPDADQTLSRVEMQMPPGLLGTLSTVKLCGEPQAQEGTCGEESLIGHTTVSVGLGDSPYTVTGGKVYITTGYKGAPYGLSIVNPAKAGPFDLEKGTPCDCVVVRASIGVDRQTAALTIKSDPLPTVLDGIPLQIQHVNVSVDREKFTFNPTNCNKMAIDGTLSSTEGAAAAVSTSFQVTNCATLAFKPKFSVSTSGKTSKANGASLHVKLSYPEGPYDANIARVKVDLPKQLPSRLTTLQKACTAAQFETNPAGCPAASLIGSAIATTPVLPVPLSGPVYFVSHGGEAFPSLIVVLQGYGTTVDLVGSTFISKSGITSSTFKTVPDVPVGTFELNLLEGKYSALAANGNLCTSKLAMPTEFLGQNGAKINESTPIGVTGCTKTKALTRAQKLAKALKACKKSKSKSKREGCVRHARKEFGRSKR